MVWCRGPLAAACLVGALLPTSSDRASAANLFDAIASIFGGERAPSSERPGPVRQYYRYDDLEPADEEFRPRQGFRVRPSYELDRDERARGSTAVAMDPVKVPDWYLKDTTLRRGDIVVLDAGVFVFEGGRGSPVPDDFVPLERSRLAAPERAKIAAMTGYRPALVAAAPRARTAAAEVAGQAATAPNR